MKPFGWVALLVAPVLVVALLVLLRGDQGGSGAQRATRPAATDPMVQTQIERLSRRVRELETTVETQRQDMNALRGAFRESLSRQAAGDGGAGGPDAYLDQYVLSFQEGGSGSEYFRLAVDAHATLLLDRILAIIRDRGAAPMLRQRLVQLVGTARFRGNPRVIGTLTGLLKNDTPKQLALIGLKALLTVGDTTAAPDLERYAEIVADDSLRQRAYQALMQLAGPDRNRTLRRLLSRASNPKAQRMLVGWVGTDDPATALDIFRDAWALDEPVREAAAARLGRFRTDPFRQFVDDKLATETSKRVRKRLEQAKVQQSRVPSYDALKATGKPDATPTRDDPNAWASREGNMGRQWIELTYSRPMRASSVRIYEVNSAGAVAEVQTIDDRGVRRTVWRGQDPTQKPGVFDVRFQTTPYRVHRVRVVLETDRRPSWNEIDAVELVGPDGRAWAAHAVASSTFGQ